MSKVNAETCPHHALLSTDAVGTNSKQEPVYRCVGTPNSETGNPPHQSHYFTVHGETTATPPPKAKKAKR